MGRKSTDKPSCSSSYKCQEQNEAERLSGQVTWPLSLSAKLHNHTCSFCKRKIPGLSENIVSAV